ncbi:MAG: DUF6647 family protein [Aquisalimonadaceae bacterium]
MGAKTHRSVRLTLGVLQVLIMGGVFWIGSIALSLDREFALLRDDVQLIDGRLEQEQAPVRKAIQHHRTKTRDLTERVTGLEMHLARTIAVERILPLLWWISQNSDYEWRAEFGIPEMQVLETKELAQRLFINPVDATPERIASISERIEGIYRFMDRTIYIREGLDLNSIYGKSALLHELVHFLQYETGMHKRVDCRAQLERDAYNLQNKYLAQHEESTVSDAFTITMRSACWDSAWGS